MTETKGTAVTDLLPMIRQWDQQYYYRSIEADNRILDSSVCMATMKTGSQCLLYIRIQNPTL